MDQDFQRVLKMAQDTIRQSEENILLCKELCGLLQAYAAYELLGVQPDCTDAELKSAYRRKVAYWHPDKLHATDIPTEMKEYATRELTRVNEAYRILKTRRSSSVPL